MKLTRKIVLALLFLSSVSFLEATELMTPATQLGAKRVHAEAYYRHLSKQDLSLTIGGNTSVVVKKSTITSSTTADLESEGSGDGVMAKITFQPFESGLQYYLEGGIGSYNLKIPSGSYSNSYATHDPGVVIGGGVKYTLVPHTIVNPALSLDLSATHSRYTLTKFSAGDGKLTADTGFLLTLFEIQGALTLSRKMVFKIRGYPASFDPYLGVKVTRIRTNLDDLSSGGHYSGTQTGVAPFFGFKFKPFPYEGLVVEGSLVNEVYAAIGLTIGF